MRGKRTGTVMLLTGNLELGHLRQRILEAEGFKVVVANTVAEASERLRSQAFELLIVCHSVDAEETARLVMRFRNANADGRVIAITLLGTMPEAFAVDRAVSGIDGPARLLEAVRELTSRSREANSGHAG